MEARSVAALAALALVSILGRAEAGQPVAFKKGPYLQNVSQRAVTVMWESEAAVPGTVRVLGDGGQTVVSPPEKIHEVLLQGLVPGRRYRYQVECAGEILAGEFATAPAAGEPFSFVVFGDSRSNAGAHRRVVERIRNEVLDFILGTGDMVDHGHSEREWQRFFDIERDLLRENVLFPSLGNHDRQGRGRTADNYRTYFALPENSPNPERYYAFTYSNSRFLVLDSNAYSFALADQTTWIEEQLEAARLDPQIRHTFVSMHHPPFSISLHGGQRELREAWTPLFQRYGVSAVFSGHDHVYSRAEVQGVRYFVSGGGGAPLYPRSKRPSTLDLQAIQYFERVNHYLRVFAVGDFVEVTAVRADGSLIESVSWENTQGPRPAPALVRDFPDSRGPAPWDSAMPTSAAGGGRAEGRSGGGTLGWLGTFGLALMAASGGVLFWTLRH